MLTSYEMDQEKLKKMAHLIGYLQGFVNTIQYYSDLEDLKANAKKKFEESETKWKELQSI